MVLERLGRLLSWARAEPPEPDPRAFLERVVDALRLAALSADDQVAALPDFVHVPDEVALLYEDAWVLVPQIREAGLLTDDEYGALERLDRHYDDMSSAPDKDWLWTLEAMKRDDRWTKSRQLAVDALATLGRRPGRPEFPRTTWIPAGD
jgi:hypothetical protein